MNYINNVVNNIYNQDRIYGYIFSILAGMMCYFMMYSYGLISLIYAVMFVFSAWCALACFRVITNKAR
jgi:hypothetical protein